jgi:GNAT superfamily N-acetyltransferase
MSGSPVIRFVDQSESAAVATMLRQMDMFYRPGATLPDPATYLEAARRTIETREGTRFALAFLDGEPVGIACIAVVRPGHNLAGLVFLKDLFVTEAARSHGIGTLLMRFLARFAVDHDLGRLDLTTGRDNMCARRLYGSLGGETVEKVYFSFPAEQLRRLAGDAG